MRSPTATTGASLQLDGGALTYALSAPLGRWVASGFLCKPYRLPCPPGDAAYNVSKAGVKVLTEARILWSIQLGPTERPWGALACRFRSASGAYFPMIEKTRWA